MGKAKGFDFAWTKPSPQQVRNAGGSFICGYFSTDTSKNLNRNNIQQYLLDAISVVTVWETTAQRALSGYAGGSWDVHQAEAERSATTLPRDCVHHLAVDFDAEWSQVEAYFAGAAATIGQHRVGVYGGIKVIEGAYAAGYRYLWQTVAWSGGRLSPHATLYQDGETMWGGSADVDIAEAQDYGQSPRPTVPVPPVKPPVVPPPVVEINPEENEMVLVTVDRGGVPQGETWPGIFLLGSDGKLTHVSDDESLHGYEAAKIPGPVTISWAEYLARK